VPIATNASRLLAAAGVDHEIRTYDLTTEEFSAEAVADAIGMPWEQVFKTLVVAGDAFGPAFAVVPAGTELDLRALAAATGARKLALVPVAELPGLTGYRRGGVTVMGAKKRLPVYLDASAADHDRIAVSAGSPGAQIVLATADYLAVTDATLLPIARS
jgi:Cys-tRNA(Pro)/Cys-tRNA(Cys) deacylase